MTLSYKPTGKLIPLQLDVTNRQHMDAAFERVEQECGGRLFAVVNNAGVGLGGVRIWKYWFWFGCVHVWTN